MPNWMVKADIRLEVEANTAEEAIEKAIVDELGDYYRHYDFRDLLTRKK